MTGLEFILIVVIALLIAVFETWYFQKDAEEEKKDI